MTRQRTNYIETVEAMILQSVAGSPRPILSIIGAVDAPESTVRRAVTVLMARGELKDCGLASLHGYSMRGTNVHAYGLPKHALDSPEDLEEVEAEQLRPRSKSGSGVIAPPPYATGYRWGNV